MMFERGLMVIYLLVCLVGISAFLAGIAWKRILIRDQLEWQRSLPFFSLISISFIFLGLAFVVFRITYQERKIAYHILITNSVNAYKNGREDGKREILYRNELEKVISERMELKVDHSYAWCGTGRANQ